MDDQKDLITNMTQRFHRAAGLLALLCLVCLIAPQTRAQSWRDKMIVTDSLTRAEEFVAAGDSLRQIIAQAEADPGTPDTALGRIYYKIGYNALQIDDYERALTGFNKALAIYTEHLGPSDIKIGKISNSLGFACQRLGNYEAAESHYLNCLKIMEAVYEPDDPALLTYIENLAVLYITTSELSKAEPVVARQVAISESAFGPDDYQVAVALGIFGDLLRHQGRFAEAEPPLRRSVAICRKTLEAHDPDLAVSLTDLANMLSEAGRYEAAEELFREALSIWEQNGDPDVLAGIYNLGLNYYRQGNYYDAEPLLRRSLSMTRKTYGPDHPELAHDLQLLAILYTELGLRREAENMYTEAIRISETALGPDNPLVALELNNLAMFYTRQGRYSEAEPLLTRSLEIYRDNMPAGHVATANAAESLADLYASVGRDSAAAELYEEAVRAYRSVGTRPHPKIPSMLISLGLVYQRLDRSDTARSLQAAAATLLAASGDTLRPDMARCFELASDNFSAIDSTDRATEAAGKAYETRYANLLDFSDLLSERDALVYSTHLRQAVDRYMTCLSKQGFERSSVRASEVVLASKGVVTDVMVNRRRSLAATTDSISAILVATCGDLKRRISDLHVSGTRTYTPEQLMRLVDSLATEVNDIEAALARHSGDRTVSHGQGFLSIEQIVATLPADAALVEYMRFDEPGLESTSHYVALILKANTTPAIRDLGDGRSIENQVDRYRRHLADVASSGQMPTMIDQVEYDEISQSLYSLLWQPVADLLDDRAMVILAPDGMLNLVSFAGLRCPDGRFLAEILTLHYLSSGRDLLNLASSGHAGHGCLAMGDPDYDASAAVCLAPVGGTDQPHTNQSVQGSSVRSGCGELDDVVLEALPYTRSEVEAVTAAWQASNADSAIVCLGPKASEECFRLHAPGKRILHLATHGYFLDGSCSSEASQQPALRRDITAENPLLLSGLFFAGANRRGAGADSLGAEDGVLTAYEVSVMDLCSVDLVVLSACETGLGEVHDGEGVYGLRRAFQMAGVRTVVSALWPIPDQFTSELLGGIYDPAAQTGIAARLASVQRQALQRLRDEGKPDHPVSWAGFIALGDWR